MCWCFIHYWILSQLHSTLSSQPVSARDILLLSSRIQLGFQEIPALKSHIHVLSFPLYLHTRSLLTFTALPWRLWITATHRHLFFSDPKWRPGWRSRCSDPERAESFGVCTTMGARFSVSVLPAPGAYPALCTTDNGAFPVGKAARSWRWPPTPSSDEVKERVELHLEHPHCLCTFGGMLEGELQLLGAC